MVALQTLVGRRVGVITSDGRHLLGNLHSADTLMNVVLSGCVERLYSMDASPAEDALGVMLLRGSHIVAVVEVDTNAEAELDVAAIRAPNLSSRCI
jgi:U6 snRNA-associated Sm-like protein LSm8